MKIEAINIKKTFGNKNVLNGINLQVEEGQSLVIIGGSGTGKSVLLKSIIGLMQPSAGTIKIDGIDFSTLTSREKSKAMAKFGYLFQAGALFDSLTIWENVAFGLLNFKKMPKEQAKKIALVKMQEVGLNSDVANLFPSSLSGGMQKRASLARTIATHPEIIFFDEPTSGLDPVMSDVINNLIIKCKESLQATTITITHDMKSALKIADKIAMISGGKIIWQGSKEDVKHTDNENVREFMNATLNDLNEQAFV